VIFVELENQQHVEDTSELIEAGIFTWVVESNLIYGDSLVASLFGLDPANAAQGLPFEDYFARVHEDDRDETKRLIKQAILDGQPYQAEHRLMDASGNYRWSIAMGRCFQNANSMPLLFSGIVYPIDHLTDQPEETTQGGRLDGSG
jgi:PAS domain S-box-containing protein